MLNQPVTLMSESSPITLRPATFADVSWISTTKLWSQSGPKSSWRFKTKTTAGATILAAT